MTKFRKELNDIMISHSKDAMDFTFANLISEGTSELLLDEAERSIIKYAEERVTAILYTDIIDEDEKSVFVYTVKPNKIDMKLAYVIPTERGKGILRCKLDELYKRFKIQIVVQARPDYYIPKIMADKLTPAILMQNGKPNLGLIVRGFDPTVLAGYTSLDMYKFVISYLQDSDENHEDIIALLAYDAKYPQVGIINKMKEQSD